MNCTLPPMLGSRDQDTSLLLYNSGAYEIATYTIRKQPQFDLWRVNPITKPKNHWTRLQVKKLHRIGNLSGSKNLRNLETVNLNLRVPTLNIHRIEFTIERITFIATGRSIRVFAVASCRGQWNRTKFWQPASITWSLTECGASSTISTISHFIYTVLSLLAHWLGKEGVDWKLNLNNLFFIHIQKRRREPCPRIDVWVVHVKNVYTLCHPPF